MTAAAPPLTARDVCSQRTEGPSDSASAPPEEQAPRINGWEAS
jgi:hypothetical protein